MIVQDTIAALQVALEIIEAIGLEDKEDQCQPS